MSANPDPESGLLDEASRWFARLNATTVTLPELEAFRTWRREPGHAEAYAEVEAAWRKSGALQGDPDIEQALSAIQAKASPRWRMSLPLVGGAAALAALCIGAIIFVQLAGRPAVYETAVGEQRSVVLSDGTRIELDTNTRLAVRYEKAARVVSLERGQALFDVVHNVDRPFRVLAGPTQIADLGTEFDVRRDHDQVRVTLVSGAVQVETGGVQSRRLSLAPGQQLLASPHGAQTVSIDAAKITSWTTGRLVFDALPLASATQEVNRYGRHKVILDAGAVGEIRVSGTFESTDTDAFVSAVSRLYDLTVRREADGSIVLSAPPEKSSA